MRVWSYKIFHLHYHQVLSITSLTLPRILVGFFHGKYFLLFFGKKLSLSKNWIFVDLKLKSRKNRLVLQKFCCL